MTTAAARVRASGQPAPVHARPALRLIPGRAAIAGRVPFAILVGTILGSGLIALLLLHTMAAQDAFRLHDLQRQAADLRDTQQQLAVSTQQLESPAHLAARARQLGMVPTGSISFVRLHNGRLVGVAKAAAPPVAPAPSASASPTTTTSATSTSSTGASSGSTGRHPAGCSHAHCRTTARSR